MKKLLLFITSLMATVEVSAQGVISETQRKFAQTYLEKTSQEFLKSIENLTEEQLLFKPKESKWSILECAEHIAITEETLKNVVQKQLKLPADSVLVKSLRMTEKKIIDRLTFRLIKVNAPEQIKPTGRFTDISSAKQAFIQQRKANISYVISNNDALLHHYWKHPATGTINLYHTIILMAAHCKRHTLQIEEIKNHKAFPKS
jgi:DinB superfamily